MATKKPFWTVSRVHEGSKLSSGVIYWRQDSIWTNAVEDAHKFRSTTTAEKELDKLKMSNPDARVEKITPW